MAKKQLDTKQVAKDFKNSMLKVAKMLDKSPDEVSNAEFKANDPLDINPWSLKEVGGFTNLKKMYFPPQKNIVTETASKLVSSHRNKIEKEYGTEIFLKEEILALLKELLAKNPLQFHKPVKKKKAKKKKVKKNRTIFAHMSDMHYGCVVSGAEVGLVNEWNWTVAARRTALFIEQIINYKPHYRDHTNLVLCLNGDTLAGLIHNTAWHIEPLATQFSGALQTLGQAISYLAMHFDNVRVVCTSGNHGRSVHNGKMDRATVHKWDSYETQVYASLRYAMRDYTNITFDIPEAPFALIKEQGHTYLQTHGDTVINVGNPGKNINIKAINNQINKMNSGLSKDGQLREGEGLDAVLVGHMHTPLVQLMEANCYLMMNGCLIGTDPFAQSIGIFSNNPTQTLFEATVEHAVGDFRMIQVKEADNQKRLDDIVKPFVGKY